MFLLARLFFILRLPLQRGILVVFVNEKFTLLWW